MAFQESLGRSDLHDGEDVEDQKDQEVYKKDAHNLPEKVNQKGIVESTI
jgi:hypothetical protein